MDFTRFFAERGQKCYVHSHNLLKMCVCTDAVAWLDIVLKIVALWNTKGRLEDAHILSTMYVCIVAA